MPTISVIVPVYKVEPYLNRCVDSILRQTYQDFELILVDDGSPDRCGEICGEYARQDGRVHVIHKENGGLSDARNAGIDGWKQQRQPVADFRRQRRTGYTRSCLPGCWTPPRRLI